MKCSLSFEKELFRSQFNKFRICTISNYVIMFIRKKSYQAYIFSTNLTVNLTDLATNRISRKPMNRLERRRKKRVAFRADDQSIAKRMNCRHSTDVLPPEDSNGREKRADENDATAPRRRLAMTDKRQTKCNLRCFECKEPATREEAVQVGKLSCINQHMKTVLARA